MVDVSPFKGFRKKEAKKFSDITNFICPPYDVISPEGRAALVKKSATNVVQLELPAGPPATKYRKAARILRKWNDSVLQQDREPSFYLLETTYRIKDAFAPKKSLKRYGVLAGVKLETPGKGAVKPHERTLPKAKEDRLKLYNAIQMNVSPIFGLFFDTQKVWRKWVKKCIKSRPLSQAKEDNNRTHKMWKIGDPKLLKELKKVLKKKDLYIADGHHRYEVAWAFQESRLQKHPSAAQNEGWRYVMTYICPMEEPGLLMLPTHRLVKNEKTLNDWKNHLLPIFDCKKVPSVKKMVQDLVASKPKDHVFGWVNKEGYFLLKLKKGISPELCLGHRPSSLRSLDVVFLHDLILDEYNGAKYVKDQNIFYTQSIEGMFQKAKKDPAWVGFVLRSAGVQSLARVAEEGEVMPPKTTYFYPKVPTGFTLMPLNRKITNE